MRIFKLLLLAMSFGRCLFGDIALRAEAQEHIQPKETIQRVIVQVDHGKGQIILTTRQDDQIHVKSKARLSKNKDGTALFISAPRPSSEGTGWACEVGVPPKMQVLLRGGEIDLGVKEFEGALSANAGKLHCYGEGKISRLFLNAGHAEVSLKGILGDARLNIGQGDLTLGYAHEPIQGLGFNRGPRFRLTMAQGTARLHVPKIYKLLCKQKNRIQGEVASAPLPEQISMHLDFICPPEGVQLYLERTEVLP